MSRARCIVLSSLLLVSALAPAAAEKLVIKVACDCSKAQDPCQIVSPSGPLEIQGPNVTGSLPDKVKFKVDATSVDKPLWIEPKGATCAPDDKKCKDRKTLFEATNGGTIEAKRLGNSSRPPRTGPWNELSNGGQDNVLWEFTIRGTDPSTGPTACELDPGICVKGDNGGTGEC